MVDGIWVSDFSVMVSSRNWLNLTDLGKVYGISAIQCGSALKEKGWCNQFGKPTPQAFQAGAASTKCRNNPDDDNPIWNAKVCCELLKDIGYTPINRTLQIEQWAKLLEALEEGSPSINTTAAQMAEDLPIELIDEVNIKLASRGCIFRVSDSDQISKCRAKSFSK